jgi:hypothetical protein
MSLVARKQKLFGRAAPPVVPNITFGARASNAGGLTLSAPAGAAIGDLLIAFIETNSQEPTTPSGWTLLGGQRTSFSPSPGAGYTGLYLYCRSHDGSSAYAWADSGDHTAGCIAAVTEAHGYECFTALEVNSITTATTTWTVGTAYVTEPNTLVVVAISHAIDTNSTAIGVIAADGGLASSTEFVDYAHNTNAGGGLYIFGGSKATTGYSTALTATGSSSSRYCFAKLLIWAELP